MRGVLPLQAGTLCLVARGLSLGALRRWLLPRHAGLVQAPPWPFALCPCLLIWVGVAPGEPQWLLVQRVHKSSQQPCRRKRGVKVGADQWARACWCHGGGHSFR